jgi:hypothetical protein
VILEQPWLVRIDGALMRCLYSLHFSKIEEVLVDTDTKDLWEGVVYDAVQTAIAFAQLMGNRTTKRSRVLAEDNPSALNLRAT